VVSPMRHQRPEHGLSAADRLLIKTLLTEKGWTVEIIIVEFPVRH